MALYLDIASRLRARIAAGEFAPGTYLPTLSDLAREFDASGPTVRRAQGVLVDEGLLVPHHGRGVEVVAATPPVPRIRMTDEIDSAILALQRVRRALNEDHCDLLDEAARDVIWTALAAYARDCDTRLEDARGTRREDSDGVRAGRDQATALRLLTLVDPLRPQPFTMTRH